MYTDEEIKQLAIASGRTEANVRDLLEKGFKIEPREPDTLFVVEAAKVAFDYSCAVLDGLSGAVLHALDTIINPMEQLIYPISRVLYDATLIMAAHAYRPNAHGTPSDLSSEHNAARQAIINNPQLY